MDKRLGPEGEQHKVDKSQNDPQSDMHENAGTSVANAGQRVCEVALPPQSKQVSLAHPFFQLIHSSTNTWVSTRPSVAPTS